MTNSKITFIKEVFPKLNVFNDFYEITKKYKNKEKGDFFEIITKYIFQHHYYYKNITKNIWLYDEIPIDLFAELNIPNKDKGIDLVLLTTDNKYYAIQSKYRYNKKETITWNDLGTFVGMTFGISGHFAGAFYITNTMDINIEIQRCNKITTLYGDFFNTLNKDFFEQIKLPVSSNIYQPHAKRDYQIEFVDKCVDHFKDNDRGFGNIACGIGKTLMSYWVYCKLNPKIAIIGVPSLYLLTQFFKEWAFESNADKHKLEFLLVGSDAEIKQENYQNNGLLLTTDETEINLKISNFVASNNTNLVIITTFQSANRLKNTIETLKVSCDFAIIDEAHKTCQQKDSMFSFLLDNNNLKINKRLFMTATPRIYRTIKQNDKEEDIDNNVISMDNEKWYGKEIYKYSIRQGIDGEYLCPYQILTLFTEDAFINNFIKSNNIVKTDQMEKVSSYYMATAIMVIKSFQNHDCNHLVTYHNTNANSKAFVLLLRELIKLFKLDIHILQIDGTMSMKMRTKTIDAFTDYTKCVLASARVLNEGINIPIIDSVCFVDQRDSTIDITQCIGRALRLYPQKTLAKIIVPYVVSNINELESDSYFLKLISIIKSLSESDESIKEYFKTKNTDKVVGKLINHVNYLTEETTVIVAEKVDINKWFDNIDLTVWKRIDSFDYYYNQLVKFLAENDGKYPSQICKDPIGKKVGTWLWYTRKHKKDGILASYKIKMLESLPNFRWIIMLDFNTRLNDLRDFITKNNRYPVCTAKCEIEVSLASWIMTQRKYKKANKLSDEEIKQLESLSNFRWTIQFDHHTEFNKLETFVEKHGKLPSTCSKNKEETQLGHWVERQRKAKRRNKMNIEKINQLESVTGWFWEKTDPVDENCVNLIEWVEYNNRMPKHSCPDKEESKLGTFSYALRKKYENNKLTDEQIEMFNAVDDWTWEIKSIK